MHEPVVVISGASTGIGKATALHLDGLGFRVFAGVRKEADGKALSAEASSRLRPIILDITDGHTIKDAVSVVAEAVADSRLAGIVNNAGIAVAGPLEFIPLDDLRKQLEVNLVGHVAMTQAFLPLLRASSGRIVYVGSIAGRFAQPMMGPYAASKAAIESVADSLRVELRPWGIDVSVIEPGSIATPIWNKGNEMASGMVARVSPQIFELYGAALRVAQKISDREAARGIPPHRVAMAVAHALTARRPKTRYVVGRDAKLMIWAKRLLSDRARDALILRVGKLPKTSDAIGDPMAEAPARQPIR